MDAVLLLAAVILIVLALVYFLVATIFALKKIADGLDETITAVVEIIEKSAPVNDVVNTINTNLDAAVDALEGLLVKKAGMVDAVGLVDGLYPGAAKEGFRNFEESKTVKAPRISTVYTRGTLTLARLGREAPIAVAEPGGRGAAGCQVRQPRRPPALPRRPARPLADHRHRFARAIRGARCRLQRRLITSGRRASRARSPRCKRARELADHRRRPQPAADDEAAAGDAELPDRHQRPRPTSPTSARRATSWRSGR